MFEIVIGVISGIVSGTGMGGGTILIFLLTFFLWNRATYCTSNKFDFFYSYFFDCNNCEC